jgi:hypothetical protein
MKQRIYFGGAMQFSFFGNSTMCSLSQDLQQEVYGHTGKLYFEGKGKIMKEGSGE